MKTYKVLADNITGAGKTTHSNGDVVSEINLINITDLINCGAIELIDLEPKAKAKAEKS
jgi:hypothetical protein